MRHIHQFEPSYYQFDSVGRCRAHDPTECKFRLCQLAVTRWIAESCCNVPSSMALVHAGTKTEVARISKKFSHRLANSGADHSDDTHRDFDASRCLWALYYGRRPDLINLGSIHLPFPLNRAWGVLSYGPYTAADVVNLLKPSVRKGDTEEDVEWRSVMH